jgi:hypothetical protein
VSRAKPWVGDIIARRVTGLGFDAEHGAINEHDIVDQVAMSPMPE